MMTEQAPLHASGGDRRVVLALHGYGSTGAEIAAVLSAVGGHQTRILAPDGPEPATLASHGRSWYPLSSVPEAMRARACPVARRLAAYLREVQRRRRLGPEHCCVVGFSQGSPVAALLVELGVARSAVLICGRIPRPTGPWPPGIRALAIAGELDHFAPPDVMRADLTASGLDAVHRELLILAGLGHELRPDIAAIAMAFAAAPTVCHAV
jgi:predicted esterase